MLIVFVILALFVVCATLISNSKKIYKRVIAFCFLLILTAGLIMFVTKNPFAKPEEPEVSEIANLIEVGEGDTIVLQTAGLKLNNNSITADKCYTIKDLPDNCIYLFIDEDNRLYYLEEEKVVVAKLHSQGGLEAETIYSYPVQIIIGEYEAVYAEKSVIRNKVTLWTIGNTVETKYTFYIPPEVAE